MKVSEIAKQTVDSGIVPICLQFSPLYSFDDDRCVLRSALILRSLELGVLTPKEYRFVARRSKQGDELVKRHIDKLFRDYPAVTAQYKKPVCITLPVFPRVLMSGELTRLLFEAFAAYPAVAASRIGVELSADILFEDLAVVKQRLDELRALGVKIVISEVGDAFCPIMRLAELSFDYALADAYITELLGTDAAEVAAAGLVTLLHRGPVKLFAPALSERRQIDSARALGFDGYGSDVLPPSTEEVDEA